MLKAASIFTFFAFLFFLLAASPSFTFSASPSAFSTFSAFSAFSASGYSVVSASLGFLERFLFSLAADASAEGSSLAAGLGSLAMTMATSGTKASTQRLSAGSAVLPLARFLRERVELFFFATSPPSLLSSAPSALGSVLA